MSDASEAYADEFGIGTTSVPGAAGQILKKLQQIVDADSDGWREGSALYISKRVLGTIAAKDRSSMHTSCRQVRDGLQERWPGRPWMVCLHHHVHQFRRSLSRGWSIHYLDQPASDGPRYDLIVAAIEDDKEHSQPTR